MPEDLKNRTCLTCACMWKIEPPRIQTELNKPAPAPAPTVLVCRLNPPLWMPDPKDPQKFQVVQQQTMPYMSCWQWVPEGTLPGDRGMPSTLKVLA